MLAEDFINAVEKQEQPFTGLSAKNLVCYILFQLNVEERKKVINNQEFVEKYCICESFPTLFNGLDDNMILKVILNYKIDNNFIKTTIAQFLSSDKKIEILGKDFPFLRDSSLKILCSLDIQMILNFLENNPNFLIENNCTSNDVITQYIESKSYFASSQSIDITDFPKEFKDTFEISKPENNKYIILDLDKDLESYRGLDKFIRVNPFDFDDDKRNKFLKLCDICPNLQVANNLDFDSPADRVSTVAEYKEAESWVSSVITKIQPNHSDAQKIAIIDYEIGKKISYSPDFDTELFNENDARTLWRIISSGHGVCNGIAKVEQYLLHRVGINAELVSGACHSFLKLNNIEIPLANNEHIIGTTLLDPTWNLAAHRFGGRPKNFFINYETAREHDIDRNGVDSGAHLNDDLKDATSSIDDENLGQLFSSVGLADKDGNFPIKTLITELNDINEMYKNTPNQNITYQLASLAKYYPEFASCQMQTMQMLHTIFLDINSFDFNKCVIDRVYKKTDLEKTPCVYVYIDSNEFGKKFYLANSINEQFLEMSQKEFEEYYECYDLQLKTTNGIRPWQNQGIHEEKINLAASSGEISTKEDFGR